MYLYNMYKKSQKNHPRIYFSHVKNGKGAGTLTKIIFQNYTRVLPGLGRGRGFPGPGKAKIVWTGKHSAWIRNVRITVSLRYAVRVTSSIHRLSSPVHPFPRKEGQVSCMHTPPKGIHGHLRKFLPTPGLLGLRLAFLGGLWGFFSPIFFKPVATDLEFSLRLSDWCIHPV